MPGLRRRILPIAFVLAVLPACDRMGRDGLGPDVRRGLDEGRAAAAAWIADGRTARVVEPDAAIALGYLERLRLGLGSPFRLIDYALADPRLDTETRRTLGWALLARTVDQAAYQIDDAALDRAGLGRIETLPTIGRYHLELIEGAVRESPDPRGGELAVRLAYALAAAEGSLPPRAPELATRVAGLVRDRELARDDALRLLRTADSTGADPLRLVPVWRARRAFQVEQPPLAVLPQESELRAMELAPRLAASLRELMLRLDEIRPVRARMTPGATGVLSHAAALELGRLADSLDAPPQTPVVIAARMYRRELLELSILTTEQREDRERFADFGTSEERFVAAYSLLRRHAPYDLAPALAALTAATGLRAYAQEPPWYPGFGGPTSRELEERYGVSIGFGADVPARWRPYYRRMLDLALIDLQRVLPALDLQGLSVLFEDQPLRGATLAMHDPKGRRLLLPPGTAAGTIAHEVAHDLDWQIALRRYRVRGDYATDRASRAQTDRLALRVQDLTSGTLEPDPVEPDVLSAHARRPAEVFARNVDWFVAASLASQGRMNGYLSSVQDDILTGYGTVRPPDVTGAAGEALVNILDEVAPLYPATREWFLKSFGLSRALTPYDLARRVLEAPVAGLQANEPTASARMAMRFAEIEKAREAGSAAIDAWICRAAGAAYHRELERARRELVTGAAAARARGLALAEARHIAGNDGFRWMQRDLFGVQWRGNDVDFSAQWRRVEVDSLTLQQLEPLADAARTVARADVAAAQRNQFELVRPPARCALAPLHIH